jgi:hypothetical protein
MQDLDVKMTRANVEEWVKDKGYEPVQIDGIPEGFSYKKPDITISGVVHAGGYVAFIPLADWENESVIKAGSVEDLLKAYKEFKK